jgi:hypothetical protein
MEKDGKRGTQFVPSVFRASEIGLLRGGVADEEGFGFFSFVRRHSYAAKKFGLKFNIFFSGKSLTNKNA